MMKRPCRRPVEVKKFKIDYGQWGDKIAERQKKLHRLFHKGWCPISYCQDGKIETWILGREKAIEGKCHCDRPE